VDKPPALHAHAADNLRFIRDTMSRAGQFTAVPGWGGVAMGVTALATAALSARAADRTLWLVWWLGEAAVAIAIAIVTMTRKARRLDLPLLAAPAKRFALAYVPPLAAGAVLTAVFVGNGLSARLPGCWLLLYGVAIATAGTLSVRVVQLMGVVFMALAAASFAAPAGFGDAFMAAGFGGLHIVFGLIIARNHGG
jgi:multisubunit Na+/H+ antiporter MnhC subunit